MKNTILLLILSITGLSMLHAQSDNNIYYLQLGDKKCAFHYAERLDTVETIKYLYDTVTNKATSKTQDTKFVTSKNLDLQDTGSYSVHIKKTWIDTVTEINPVTLEEKVKIVKKNDIKYHFKTEMSYFDLLLMIKEKFELRDGKKTIRISSFGIYYEAADHTNGRIEVQYPDSYEGVVSRLNVLDKKGGFVLINLYDADHGKISINSGEKFLALINIKN